MSHIGMSHVTHRNESCHTYRPTSSFRVIWVLSTFILSYALLLYWLVTTCVEEIDLCIVYFYYLHKGVCVKIHGWRYPNCQYQSMCQKNPTFPQKCICKRALHIRKQACVKRALYLCKRALYICKRALHIRKRACVSGSIDEVTLTADIKPYVKIALFIFTCQNSPIYLNMSK